MVLKWWSVGSIVVLGLVWFVMAEQSTGAQRPLNATARAQPVTAPAAGDAETPAAIPMRQQAGSAQRTDPAAPISVVAPAVAPPATAQSQPPQSATPAPAPQAGNAPSSHVDGGVAAPRVAAPDAAPPVGGAVGELIASAARQNQAGDLAGAEASLRRAIQTATTAREAARAGLQLAPLTRDLLERRHLISAALLEDVVVGAEYDQVGSMLRDLNQSPGSSLQPALKLETYAVAPNDSLWKLCNKVFPGRFGQSPEVGLVRIVNGLHTDSLKVGQQLKVPTEALRLSVSMANHGLTAFVGETAVAAYWIGLGKESRTPRDTFVIQVKQEDPAWFNGTRTIPFGDAENVLGTRWMGFEPKDGAHGFGIHGTAHPESIGKDESMGCVRMRNAEVEELFEYVPRGTRVAIG
ncbi:MAG: L,D-transpeptidase family protein [Gemmatimonadaceae bacterium]